MDVKSTSWFARRWLAAAHRPLAASAAAGQSMFALGLMIVLLQTGCSDPTVVVNPDGSGLLPPANPAEAVTEENKPQVVWAGEKPWLDTKSLPIDCWYSQYLNGVCIGYSQVTIAPSETQGASLLRLTKRDVLEVAATAQQSIQRREIVLESLERPDGQFLRYTESTDIDGVTAETTTELARESLIITKRVDGKSTAMRLPWPKGAWGPLGTIAILRQLPMQPNEQRTAQVFVPQLSGFVQVELKSGQWEWTALPGGIVSELLPVETALISAEGTALAKNWVNPSGEIVKSVSQGGYTMFQSSRDSAENIDSEIRVAQLMASTIRVSANAAQFQSSQIAYRIDSSGLDPYSLLSQKVNQQVQSLSALGAEVRVFNTAGAHSEGTDGTELGKLTESLVQDLPDAAYSQPIEADTPQLQKFLSELPSAELSARETAAQLTDAVFRGLAKEKLSRHFATPAKTLQKGSGDCKAHSMLLIAALRQRGIPARAASGLHIGQAENDILAAYHMWCEAWLGDRWLPLDPHLGTVGVGVDHLKCLESSLNNPNPNSAVLPVLQAMKQFTITVKSP